MSGDHTLEQSQVAVALEARDHLALTEKVEYADEKHGVTDSLAEAQSHPTHDDDGEVWVHPTPEELNGPHKLRRVVDKIPWPAYLIGIVEMAERFSFYGSSAVFTNFIQRPLPLGSHTGKGGAHGVSGALGLGQQASTGLTTFYQFWVYCVPLGGGYIADTYLGRYRTVCWSVLIALIGHIILVISAVPGVIEHPDSAVAVFSIALIIMGIGTGGFKACISPLVAEQYKVTAPRVKVLKSGERVIVDPVYTTARIYMWFYLLINVGALVGQIGMTYGEKYIGFWFAYALPTIVFFLCPLVLWVGRNRYARAPPEGSVLGTSMRIWGQGLKGTWSWNPKAMLRAWNAPDFWEKARPVNVIAANGGVAPAWLTYDDNYVDEVKRGLKACAVFVFYPLWWLTYNQINNNLTSQAATMTTGSVPNDVINNLDPFALIIFIPITAKFIYPWTERYIGFRWTPIRKIFLGFWVGTAAMIWAAVVQHYVYKTSPCGSYANSCVDENDVAIPSPLSVWIQSGSYVLIAFSEIFASITGLEYAFTKAPKNMRTLVMAVFYFASAISSAIGEAMNPLATDPHLVWNYTAPAIISFVAGAAFWWCFKDLDKQEDELNLIGILPTEAEAAQFPFVNNPNKSVA